MGFFEDFEYRLERERSFADLRVLTYKARKETKKLGRIVDEYRRFEKNNPDFFKTLHEIHDGIKKYYCAFYENCEIRDRLQLSEFDRTKLRKLANASYFEEKYNHIAEKHNTQKYATPATEKLNQFLSEKNEPLLQVYADNIKAMVENEKYAEDRIFSDEQQVIFNKNKSKLIDIFNRFDKQEQSLNKLNKAINDKAIAHIKKYQPSGLNEINDHLLPLRSDSLKSNKDYVALTEIDDVEELRWDIRQSTHAKYSASVM